MLHLIYNPLSGNGRARRMRDAIEPRLTALGVAHRFHETQGPHHATDLARQLTRAQYGDCIDLVAMGGDGTLHEVLNGLEDPSMVRLGIVPCGSGNDFAAVAGIPEDPAAALDLLLNGTAKYTDYMECGGVRGINAIGTGIDVDILRRYSRMKLLKGSPAYLASFVRTLLTYRASDFQEIADDECRQHHALIACAANGQRIGGGIPICPGAKIDDGLLDIVIVDDIPRMRIPGSFVKLFQQRLLELPTTTFRRDDHLTIQSDAPMAVQIDGEIYENLPFDVKIVSNVLRMYRA